MTLREGHERTGIPVSTLRKWAMGGNVPTYMQETAVGEMRMISLQGVYLRAQELGRKIDGAPPSTPAPSSPEAVAPKHHQDPATTPATKEAEVPPGTTLVPLDAWNKMLLQLGNLHEAGQQLAEASARAAKAETEAAFLKERLSELRDELAKVREAEPAPEPVRPTPQPKSSEPPPGNLGILRQIYSSWRKR